MQEEQQHDRGQQDAFEKILQHAIDRVVHKIGVCLQFLEVKLWVLRRKGLNSARVAVVVFFVSLFASRTTCKIMPGAPFRLEMSRWSANPSTTLATSPTLICAIGLARQRQRQRRDLVSAPNVRAHAHRCLLKRLVQPATRQTHIADANRVAHVEQRASHTVELSDIRLDRDLSVIQTTG